MILILFRRPIFHRFSLPDLTDTIRRALSNLNHWRDVSFMRVPLEVIFKFARDIVVPAVVQNVGDDADHRPAQDDGRGMEGLDATATALRSALYPPMDIQWVLDEASRRNQG
jgi:hypothetical protein